jgi:hypothetical protein
MNQEKMFITFGGPTPNYRKRSQELAAQSSQMGIFTKSIGLNDDFLKSNKMPFWQKHGEFLETNKRGYGHWLWKPFIIKTFLDKLKPNDILVYADAGCVFNPEGIKRMTEYIDILNNDEKGILAFQLSSALSERKYCKRQVLEHLEVTPEIMNSGQCVGGIILLRKTEFSQKFIDTWYSTAEHHELINDSMSYHPEYPDFVDHRHDQAIYSCLVKKMGIKMIPDETYFSPNWNKNGKDYPIWAVRKRT